MPDSPFVEVKGNSPTAPEWDDPKERLRRYYISLCLIVPAWVSIFCCLFFPGTEKTTAGQILILASNVISGVGGFWVGASLKQASK
jgi:hypothetical protein